jgi:NAD(P)-dependent dehydrogenase (short-subunit alcohol dehydrogenase family)
VALITGASRGIGQGIAVRFAAEGAKVVAVGRPEATRNKELAGSLGETLALIEEAGGEAIAGHLDLEDLDFDKGQLFRHAESVFGAPVDILVNDAAAPREYGGGGFVPFAEMSREFFYRTVAVNVWGAWDLAKQAIPDMRRRGAGWILSISSIQAAPRPTPTSIPESMQRLGGSPLYGGSKAFLDRMTTGAAQELYGDNIAVNTLAPTSHIDTPLSSGRPRSGTYDDPFGRPTIESRETFAEAALALCSGDPRVLTSRIVNSLPILAELNRPVYHLDGKRLYEEWQPSVEDPRKQQGTYLTPFLGR